MNRYILQQSTGALGWWTVTDTDLGIVCQFQEGDFNGTQKFAVKSGYSQVLTPSELASAAREIGDWLVNNHYELLFR